MPRISSTIDIDVGIKHAEADIMHLYQLICELTALVRNSTTEDFESPQERSEWLEGISKQLTQLTRQKAALVKEVLVLKKVIDKKSEIHQEELADVNNLSLADLIGQLKK